MLERQELLISPWSDAEDLASSDLPGPVRIRRIADPAGGPALGFVAWSAVRSWWPGRGLTLRMHEDPDASLLMTVVRPWGPFRSWQVHDAEERRVGTFYRGYLFDGLGYLLACLHDEESGGGRFLTRPGVQLGAWRHVPAGTVLTFADVPESSPFARMLLLGKVLSLELPGRW